jgi:hypothetical protein
MPEYDARKKETERRQPASMVVRYWPLLVFVITLTGSSITFYSNMQALAADVSEIKTAIPVLVLKSDLALELRFRDQAQGNLSDRVNSNQDRTEAQFSKIDDKLDAIADMLYSLNQVKKDQ